MTREILICAVLGALFELAAIAGFTFAMLVWGFVPWL
jgi:hypothetical protein